MMNLYESITNNLQEGYTNKRSLRLNLAEDLKNNLVPSLEKYLNKYLDKVNVEEMEFGPRKAYHIILSGYKNFKDGTKEYEFTFDLNIEINIAIINDKTFNVGTRCEMKPGDKYYSVTQDGAWSWKGYSLDNYSAEEVINDIDKLIKDGITKYKEIRPDFADKYNFKDSEDITESKDWLSNEELDWLSTQNHLDKLNEISMNYNATGDIDDDQRHLNDLASDYFYDEVGTYNENIDSLCTKWAHDQATKINEAITNKED